MGADHDLVIVRAAVYLLRSMGEHPSASRVIAVLRAGSSRKRGGMNRGVVCALITEVCRDRSETARANPETDARPDLSTQETVSENPETAPRHHARVKTIDIRQEQTPKVPTRRRRHADPLPELPESVRADVARLVANDAAERRDGMIADSVVEGNLTVLRRAFERRGDEALVSGIDVALGKGKGVRYAAGCVRNYAPSANGQPRLFSETTPDPTDRLLRPAFSDLPPEYQAKILAERGRG